MGYTTRFKGQFDLNRPLEPHHAAYLHGFAGTRRCSRDPEVIVNIPDPLREAVGLPLGEESDFFVGAGGFHGQDYVGTYHDEVYRKTHTYSGNIYERPFDYNSPPKDQPGLWCQWVPNENGTAIEWDRSEKFYYYVEWLQYLIEKFLQPWGYQLNGEVFWYGGEDDDTGKIVAINNQVSVFTMSPRYEQTATNQPS